MSQPKIGLDQIITPWDAQFNFRAQTKINAAQEVFMGGICLLVYSADNTLDPDRFVVQGDYDTAFTTGTVFHVAGSTGNNADYTCVADATFAAGLTTIYVTNGSITTNEGAGLGTGTINTGSRIVLPDNSASMITVYAVARDTTTTGAGAGLVHRAVFTRDVGAATVALIGTVQSDFIRETMTGTPDVDLAADTTNGSIQVTITNGSTNLSTWNGLIVLQQIVP